MGTKQINKKLLGIINESKQELLEEKTKAMKVMYKLKLHDLETAKEIVKNAERELEHLLLELELELDV